MSGREKSAQVHNFLADAPRDFTQGSKIQEKEVWRFEITKKLLLSLFTVFENHKKVSFNIASEASYVYIFQKFIKNAKNGQFVDSLKLVVKQCYQIGIFDRAKIDEKCQNSNAIFSVIFKQCVTFTAQCFKKITRNVSKWPKQTFFAHFWVAYSV